MPKVGSEILLAAAFGLYCAYAYPKAYTIGTLVVATVAFIMTKSLKAVLGVFVGAIFIRLLGEILQPKVFRTTIPVTVAPVGYSLTEGFQPKDPISIHQRIQSNKGQPPLNPKVREVTGILESPKILDSLQVSEVLPSEQGATTKTLPSLLAGPDAIRTPPEGTAPNSELAAHPTSLLPNGPDATAVIAALATKGTSLFGGQPSAEVAGTKLGPSAV